MESQSGSEEAGEFVWQGGMWEKRKGCGFERCVCSSTVRMMRTGIGGMWGLGEGGAGGDKKGILSISWFRLLRILVLFQKVLFCFISKYAGDVAFKWCLGFSIAKGQSWILLHWGCEGRTHLWDHGDGTLNGLILKINMLGPHTLLVSNKNSGGQSLSSGMLCMVFTPPQRHRELQGS